MSAPTLPRPPPAFAFAPPGAPPAPPPPPRATDPGLGEAGLTGAVGAPPRLLLHFQGNSVPVTKARFVIGRGKQGTDFTIKDPNVSRQHAMVEYSDGVHYLVDLGSTNGVLVNGERVQRRVIADGDEFRICDHTLRFTLA